MPIKACQGCLKDMFLTTVDAIDCFTGKELWAWGATAGQYKNPSAIGDGFAVSRSSPVQTISRGTNWKEVSAGNASSFAIKQDGTLWVWGDNCFGHLGTNDRVNRSSPAQTISSGSNWKKISVGGGFTSGVAGAIKTDGTLWMWGGGSGGTLGVIGNNTTTSVSSPVQTVSGGTNWKSISVGYLSVSAIKTDNTLWAWGYNGRGALGDGTVINRSSPVQILGNTWCQSSTSGAQTAAIKTDGTLWVWGVDTYGQLGTNARVFRSSPVQTVSGGTNWREVSAGCGHTAAIKTDGTLWLWGQNLRPFSALPGGKLGNNSNTHVSSPVQTVSGGTNWRTVSASKYFTAAIKTDGTLWTWGSGTLFPYPTGDNANIFRSSPVQTVSGGTSWKNVSAGENHALAIKEVEF